MIHEIEKHFILWVNPEYKLKSYKAWLHIAVHSQFLVENYKMKCFSISDINTSISIILYVYINLLERYDSLLKVHSTVAWISIMLYNYIILYYIQIYYINLLSLSHCIIILSFYSYYIIMYHIYLLLWHISSEPKSKLYLSKIFYLLKIKFRDKTLFNTFLYYIYIFDLAIFHFQSWNIGSIRSVQVQNLVLIKNNIMMLLWCNYIHYFIAHLTLA